MSFQLAARIAATVPDAGHYRRHQPEQTLLYRIIERHYPEFTAQLAAQGRMLPNYVRREFEDYLRCGRLEHGFLRVRCDACHKENLVAFSCKRRGFCPSCGARRMAESAALLVDEVLPEEPMRQRKGVSTLFSRPGLQYSPPTPEKGFSDASKTTVLPAGRSGPHHPARQ